MATTIIMVTVGELIDLLLTMSLIMMRTNSIRAPHLVINNTKKTTTWMININTINPQVTDKALTRSTTAEVVQDKNTTQFTIISIKDKIITMKIKNKKITLLEMMKSQNIKEISKIL